jgi:hypothetical protein
MQEFLLQVVAHPFTDIKIFLAVWAAFGVIVFFWGFIGFFLSHGHITHQDHARAYMVWGVMLTGAVILVWEGIKFLAGMLSGVSYSPVGILFGALSVMLLFFLAWKMFFGKPAKH